MKATSVRRTAQCVLILSIPAMLPAMSIAAADAAPTEDEHRVESREPKSKAAGDGATEDAVAPGSGDPLGDQEKQLRERIKVQREMSRSGLEKMERVRPEADVLKSGPDAVAGGLDARQQALEAAREALKAHRPELTPPPVRKEGAETETEGEADAEGSPEDSGSR